MNPRQELKLGFNFKSFSTLHSTPQLPNLIFFPATLNHPHPAMWLPSTTHLPTFHPSLNPLIHTFIHSTTTHPLTQSCNQPPIHPSILSSNVYSLDTSMGHYKFLEVQSLGQPHQRHLGTDRNAYSWLHPTPTEAGNRTAICVSTSPPGDWDVR